MYILYVFIDIFYQYKVAAFPMHNAWQRAVSRFYTNAYVAKRQRRLSGKNRNGVGNIG